MRFFIKTFGCQMNENDSLLLASLLNKAGHTACTEEKQADLIIVNTCCVRQNAENRALGYLGSLKSLKQNKPSLIIAVCGCMIQKQGIAEMLQEKYRQVGIIIGTFASALLPAYIQEYAANGKRIVNVEERYDQPNLEAPERCEKSYKAQVNINYGCNNFCTYCIVPFVRGRERSREPQSILDEIKGLAGQGVKEIQLLGQNVNSYGKDKPEKGWNFSSLLRRVCQIDGIERVRFMTSHPRDFNEELADTIAGERKICNHLHLPIQSGSNRILKLMNRGYTAEEYLSKLNYIREAIPDLTFTTDLIVGFPGETEEDFGQTLALIEAARFDAAYTFIYSKRSGTKAAEMPGHLSEDIKKERLQRLMDAQNPISLEKNMALLGSEQIILTEGLSKNNDNFWCGRTEGNKIVVFPGTPNLTVGQFLPVRISNTQTWNLQGELI